MSNAELIERLNAKPNRPTWDVSLGNGQTVKSMGLGHNTDDCALRKEAADALAAADKRIAELEAKIDEAYKKGYATGEEEAERKLDVAREALKQIPHALGHDFYAAATTIADEALAQIGGEDEHNEEADWYVELNRGYAKDRI